MKHLYAIITVLFISASVTAGGVELPGESDTRSLHNNPDSEIIGIEKWLLSEPLKIYGKPDLYYRFSPEERNDFSDFKLVRVSAGSYRVYPFDFMHGSGGIVYAAASIVENNPFRIWIISNSAYRLFINGVEALSSLTPQGETLSGISVKGVKGYTLLLKIADNRREDPYFRVIISDMENRVLNPEISGIVYSGTVSSEIIYSSSDVCITAGGNSGKKGGQSDKSVSPISIYKQDQYCGRYAEAESYIKRLADKAEYSAALSYAENFSEIPSFRRVISGLVKRTSTPDVWRKYLIERIAATGDPVYYYHMGNAEMERGLDPLLYWEKGLSIKSDMREVREAADIYENGMVKGSVYYSGKYAGLQPEFLWNGIKRKIMVRIFKNGRYMTECEEIIPAVLVRKGKFRLLPLKDVRVLYALKSSAGITLPSEFGISTGPEGEVSVLIKRVLEADFLVLKYTGYSEYDHYPFDVMERTELKRQGEDISEVEFEVISEGGLKPAVTFMDKDLSGSRGAAENVRVYSSNAKFNYKNSSVVTASVKNISSDREFALWYNGMLRRLKCSGIEIQSTLPLKGTLFDKISGVKNYITKNYSVNDRVTFEPRFPEEILFSDNGTTEELAILSSLILEKEGIRGFIVFIREKGKMTQESVEAAVFIPESKGKGYLLRFTEKSYDTKYEVLVVRGDGSEIIPVEETSGDR